MTSLKIGIPVTQPTGSARGMEDMLKEALLFALTHLQETWHKNKILTK